MTAAGGGGFCVNKAKILATTTIIGQTQKTLITFASTETIPALRHTSQYVTHTKKGKNENRSLPALDPGTSKKFFAKPEILHPTQKLPVAQH